MPSMTHPAGNRSLSAAGKAVALVGRHETEDRPDKVSGPVGAIVETVRDVRLELSRPMS